MQSRLAAPPDLQAVGSVFQVSLAHLHARVCVRYPHAAADATATLEIIYFLINSLKGLVSYRSEPGRAEEWYGGPVVGPAKSAN